MICGGALATRRPARLLPPQKSHPGPDDAATLRPGLKAKKTEAIGRFGDLKVLVLGDVMLDIYDFCDSKTSKASPEKPGKKVYKAQQSIRALGGGGNVAANLAALDVSTSLLSISGQDGHCFTLAALADECGIDHILLKDPSRPTTTKTRLYIDGEYILRRDDEETQEVSAATTAAILAELSKRLGGVDAVILSDYDKGFFSAAGTRQIIALCQRQKVPVIVDFKPPNSAYFKGADIIAPNHIEARTLLPGFAPDGALESQTGALYDRLECRNLVVTLGAQGLCGFTGSSFFRLPANSVEVVDSVGCGDTVRVGLALGYALGLSLEEAMDLANDTAAVVIQKIGTATLTRAELIEFIENKED
jgi:rfaE bifunctional protein kinase chain/domain